MCPGTAAAPGRPRKQAHTGGGPGATRAGLPSQSAGRTCPPLQTGFTVERPPPVPSLVPSTALTPPCPPAPGRLPHHVPAGPQGSCPSLPVLLAPPSPGHPSTPGRARQREKPRLPSPPCARLPQVQAQRHEQKPSVPLRASPHPPPPRDCGASYSLTRALGAPTAPIPRPDRHRLNCVNHSSLGVLTLSAE